MTTMTSIKKLVFLAIIWTIAILVLLAATEVFLRLTDDGWIRTIRLNVIRDRSYHEDVSPLYDTDEPNIVYRRNKYGLRDDCASPSAIDVLTIGGSTTDQRYVAQKYTYQAVMQRELSKAAGRPVCVSNAGIDGQSTYGHLMAFDRWFPLIPGLKPRVIVLYVGINDSEFTRPGPSPYDDKATPDLRGKIKRLYVVQLGLWAREVARSLVESGPVKGHVKTSKDPSLYSEYRLADDTPARAEQHAAAFRQRFRELLRRARSTGAEVVCVTQPTRVVRRVGGVLKAIPYDKGPDDHSEPYSYLDWNYTLERVSRVMGEECGSARTLDLHDAPFADADFYDYFHNTPSGSAKVGERMARFIEQSNLLDQLRK